VTVVALILRSMKMSHRLFEAFEVFPTELIAAEVQKDPYKMAAGTTTVAFDLESMGDRQPQPPANWGWRRAYA